MSTAELTRSRELRRHVIDLLILCQAGGNVFGLNYSQIVPSFTPRFLGVGAGEITRTIRDLIADKLIESEYCDVMLDTFYRVTKRGNLFRDKGYPWDAIDKLD